MLTLDEAFRKFRTRLELNEREQQNASARHTEIREYMRENLDIENDFLTGSYKRNTKTKPLKDVDIFFVLGEEERHYRDESPDSVLSTFEKLLAKKYAKEAVNKQRRSVTVDFGVLIDAEDNTDYRILSVDAVPAFASGKDYEIPDRQSGGWVKTNPKIHEEKATTAHKAYNNEWKGIVRMVKYWNNHHSKPIKPSFLLEVMALECLAPPYGGRFDYEMQSLFSTFADRIFDTWGDPACLGPAVSDMMNKSEKAAAQQALKKGEQEATLAIHLARQGKNEEALKAWRAIFGPKFPLS
jgi:hypothetical protein